MLYMKDAPKNLRSSIGLDMDNTMFDFTGQFVKFYNLYHPDDILCATDVNQDWHFDRFCKYDIQEIFRLPGFYSTMEAYDGMKEVYAKLCEKYITYIVTTTPPEQIYERMVSLRFLYPKFDTGTFVFTSQKDLVKADVVFDDAPHNFRDVTSRDDGQILVVYDQPYNRNLDTKYRVEKPEDILEFCEQFIIPKNDLILSKKTFFYQKTE